MARRMRLASAHHVPETEIPVQPVRRQRVQRKARGVGPRAQRADPDRRDAYLALEKIEKRARVLDRYVDVLNHGFRMPAAEPVQRAGDSPTAVKTHQPLI